MGICKCTDEVLIFIFVGKTPPRDLHKIVACVVSKQRLIYKYLWIWSVEL